MLYVCYGPGGILFYFFPLCTSVWIIIYNNNNEAIKMDFFDFQLLNVKQRKSLLLNMAVSSAATLMENSHTNPNASIPVRRATS